ncbi:MAG: hypothetical protein HC810_00555 [Acaryochloridaceae cyanobacterium RL_2_7]|nr:hypothetical protein [Acaryochloridaceae cyanobacterium RL_2_7]
MEQYLTFSSHSNVFGIISKYIREVFPLPELQPVVEAPGDVVGLLNLRGQLIPVLQLAKRLGFPAQKFKLSDSVIVMDWQGLVVGVLVDEVLDVIDVAAEALLDQIELDREQYVSSALIHQYAQLDETLLNVLHPESLIRQADDVAVMAWEADLQQAENESVEADASTITSFYEQCVDLAETEAKLFAKRAQDLKASIESTDISELQPITILVLEGDYFGVNLDNVREFIHVPKLTKIPCSQPHILGNFNLRGEIITLLDLSESLELETSPSPRKKAVILEIDNQRIGVAVDEVHDVVYLAQEDYLEFPATTPQAHLSFMTGALDYQGQVVRVINLKTLLELYQPKHAIAA